jgi:hypothetical protein
MDWLSLPIGATVTVLLLPHHRPVPPGFTEQHYPPGSNHARYGRLALRVDAEPEGRR